VITTPSRLERIFEQFAELLPGAVQPDEPPPSHAPTGSSSSVHCWRSPTPVASTIAAM
jgi:hypothetical protein